MITGLTGLLWPFLVAAVITTGGLLAVAAVVMWVVSMVVDGLLKLFHGVFTRLHGPRR